MLSEFVEVGTILMEGKFRDKLLKICFTFDQLRPSHVYGTICGNELWDESDKTKKNEQNAHSLTWVKITNVYWRMLRNAQARKIWERLRCFLVETWTRVSLMSCRWDQDVNGDDNASVILFKQARRIKMALALRWIPILSWLYWKQISTDLVMRVVITDTRTDKNKWKKIRRNVTTK